MYCRKMKIKQNKETASFYLEIPNEFNLQYTLKYMLACYAETLK